MALLIPLRLSGHVLDHAVDWDNRVHRWRVEVRMANGYVLRNWVATADSAWEQRQLAEAMRRR